MPTLDERLKAALSAGPKSSAALAREALGLSGPEAIVAKVADAALAKLAWAERDGGFWRLRAAVPAPADGPVLLVVTDADRAAAAEWDGTRLGEIETSISPGARAVAFDALPGALPLRSLCRALDPGRAFTTASRAAEEWRLPHGAGDDAAGALHTLAAVWEHARELASERDFRGFDALRELAERPRPRLDLAPYRFDAEFLATLPEIPGTYRFLDAGGAVFYVGKARNLRNRVNSYFIVPRQPDEKWLTITKRLREIEFAIAGSELEALLEEHRLIRELRGGLINVQAGAHPRPPRRLPDRSIFILPAVDDNRAAVWLHCRGAGLRRLDLRLAPRGVKGAADAARGFFNAARQTDAAELAIGEAWLGDNLNRLARIDPDRPDLDAALAAVLRGDAFGEGERR
ncbi:MAG: nucleotide excision repair endonuclease [Planctomycetota bacterium]